MTRKAIFDVVRSRRDFLRNDVRIQRITKNILDRMIATKTAQ